MDDSGTKMFGADLWSKLKSHPILADKLSQQSIDSRPQVRASMHRALWMGELTGVPVETDGKVVDPRTRVPDFTTRYSDITLLSPSTKQSLLNYIFKRQGDLSSWEEALKKQREAVRFVRQCGEKFPESWNEAAEMRQKEREKELDDEWKAYWVKYEAWTYQMDALAGIKRF